MKDKFDEFMEDVEQDIRQEKYQALWRKYGKMASAVLAVILLTVTAYTLWTYTQERNRENAADRFMLLQELVDAQEYEKALSTAALMSQDAVYPYNILSHLVRAALLVDKKDPDTLQDALTIYRMLEQDKNTPQFFKDLARYKRLNAELQQTDVNLDSVYAELQPLLQTDSALLPLMQELEAIILLQQNKPAQAAEAFIKIAQSNLASEDLRARAQLMSQYLGSLS